MSAPSPMNVKPCGPPPPAPGPGPKPGRHRAEPTDLVVLLALRGVAEDVVGGRDLLEALLGLGVALVRVGMMLARELAVRLRDVLLGRALRDAERLVVVLLEPFALRRHGAT